MKCTLKATRIRGFNLVETLVALVVLSVGMLGVVSLYITSMRANSSAESRTFAVYLAADMADRIRANRNVPADYEDDSAAKGNDCADESAAKECTPTELAQQDLAVWAAEISAKLPSGKGTIDETDGRYVIVVSWDEPGEGALSYTLTTDISAAT